jgi:hypothetical protein
MNADAARFAASEARDTQDSRRAKVAPLLRLGHAPTREGDHLLLRIKFLALGKAPRRSKVILRLMQGRR